jgi:short-subunit dehydrogenase
MKRVLITGASSGLGKGLALAYAESGNVLGLVARREDALQEVARAANERGARSIVLKADVRDADAMNEAVASFSERAGGIDIAIANAGVSEGRNDERIDAKRAAQLFEINVIGVSNTLLPCVGRMVEQGSGTLVGMSSVAGYRAIPGSLCYSTSKAAVITFMEGLEMELSGSGVHAMSLCPGFVRTPLTDKNEFSMPFMIECDDACARMKRAIDQKKSQYTFPLPMAVAAQIMRVAPKWLLMRASPRWRDRKKRIAAT